MRIAILGAGGVGGYYGALLARAGQDVTFLARGAHLAAMRQHGLHVQSVHGDFELNPVQASDDPGQVGPVDLVLVAVKSYDLEAAIQAAKPMVGPDTAVLPLLNGLDAAERIASILGDGPVLAGLTHISCAVAGPGTIRQVSSVRRITFGERNGRSSARAEAIRAALAAAEIEAVLTDRVDVALWEKFLFISSISGVCCLARQPIGVVLVTPETRQLFVEALQEVEALARVHGVCIAPDAVQSAIRTAEGFAPPTRPSLLAALEAGQRLELEAMSGTVVRLGRELGLPTPVHWAVYAALKPAELGRESSPSQ